MVYRTNETLFEMFDIRTTQGLCTLQSSQGSWLNDRLKKTEIAQLKGICAACPVLDTCQNIGRLYDEFTFVGGETPSERRRFRETSDYYRLLIQAAREGWLDRTLAVASQEDIDDAIMLSKWVKPALVTDWVIEDIELDVEVAECFASPDSFDSPDKLTA